MNVPIAEATDKYIGEELTAFHTPGHKQGKGAHKLLKHYLTDDGLKADVSLTDELDDLHRPTGSIKEAQKAAAKLYGAKSAFFSINGTTGAIHAMFMAALKPGDTVIMPRNIHRSVFGAMALVGVTPVYVVPDIFEGIMAGVSLASIEKAVSEHPDAKAIFLVSPNYYGMCTYVKEIAEIAHAHNMMLLVDEAHGAHLKFSSKLPEQALDLGADMSAVSTHKLLGSLTGTSMLLLGKNADESGVHRAMSMLTTTSPNQIMLASLDIARMQAEENFAAFSNAADLANELRRIVNEIRGLSSFGKEAVGKKSIADLDVTKITINTRALGISGMETAKMLRERGVVCELADPYHVLLLISYADTMKDAHAAIMALMDVANNYNGDKMYTLAAPRLPAPQAELNPREAFFAASQAVSFARCVGRIAAEEVTVYPPGIPVVLPGEIITKEISEYITEVKAAGFKITGPFDSTLRKIRVVAKEII